MRKSDVARPYPPDFCSAETLAYRLDCCAMHDYAASGLLPKPVTIGNLSRRSWNDVCETYRTVKHCPAAGAVGLAARRSR